MGFVIDKRIAKYKDVWLEKYRPRSLNELVIENDGYKRKLNEYIQDNMIPHLLFIGPPGTGKTSVAYILIDAIIKDDMDFIEMNGSLKRGIAQIAALNDFIKSETIFSKRKVIFIDEADKLTQDAQDALRNIMEEHSNHLSFIFTANYQYKLTDAIQSRMQTYKFHKLPKDHISSFVYTVLDKEQIGYQKPDVDYIITATYPDMRKCMNSINQVVYRDVNDSRILSLGNAASDFLIEHKFLESLLAIRSLMSQGQNFVEQLRYAYSLVYNDTMDYLNAFEKMNDAFREVKLKTMTAKFYNEVGRVISPKFLMIEFIGEYLNVIGGGTR